METDEHVCVPIKLYSHQQTAGHIWPVSYSLPTSGIDSCGEGIGDLPLPHPCWPFLCKGNSFSLTSVVSPHSGVSLKGKAGRAWPESPFLLPISCGSSFWGAMYSYPSLFLQGPTLLCRAGKLAWTWLWVDISLSINRVQHKTPSSSWVWTTFL